MKKTNQKGFTLIELLVVVAIIGALAAVGVVAYNGYTEAAKIRAIKAQHAMIKEYISAEILKCEFGHSKIFLDKNGLTLPKTVRHYFSKKKKINK